MHVSLPGDLERMVKDRVESGFYGSASEVVRAALRSFFSLTDERDISPEEVRHIQSLVVPRLAALDDGSAVLHNVDDVFREIDEKYFAQ